MTSKPAPVAKRTSISRQSRITTVRPEATSDDKVGNSGGMIFLGGDEISGSAQPRRAQDLYAVFRRTPQSVDLRVRQTATVDMFVGNLGDDPTESVLGEPIYADTRLVSGAPGNGLYAYPTTKDAVCVGHMPNGGGGCGEPGPHGLTVGYDDPANGGPLVLYGLVGDDVRSIDVVLGGVTRHTELTQNGYILRIPNAAGSSVEHLTLHLRDGTTYAVS